MLVRIKLIIKLCVEISYQYLKQTKMFSTVIKWNYMQKTTF